MKELNSFTIYREYYDLITLLSEKEQANLLLAIVKYMFDDIEPSLNKKETKIFINLKRPLDKSKKQSERRTKNKPSKNQTKTDVEPFENTTNVVNVNVNDNVNANSRLDIYTYIENNFNRTLSPLEYETISNWEDNELTRYAIKQSILNGVHNIKYISRILENYKLKGIKTIIQAQADEKNFKESKLKTKTYCESKAEWQDKIIEENPASEEEIKKLEERMKRK